MRLSTIIASSVLAVLSVKAQNTTVAPVSSSVSLTPAQSSQASCLSTCDPKDTSCRSGCIIVPEGDYAAQNRTVDCISACVQGNGTEAENEAYEACQKGCVASATISPSSTAPKETGTGTAKGTATGSGGKTTGTGTATEASGGSTSTGSSPSATSSKAAADTLRMGVSLTGILGMGAAILAL